MGGVELLDVPQVDRLGHARVLVDVARVIPQVRLVPQTPQVALEVVVVGGFEAHERDEHAHVGLGGTLLLFCEEFDGHAAIPRAVGRTDP